MSKIKEFLSNDAVIVIGGFLLAIPITIGFTSWIQERNTEAVIAEASRPRSVISPDGLVVDGCTVRTETVTRTTFLAPDGATVLVVEQVNETIKPRSNP